MSLSHAQAVGFNESVSKMYLQDKAELQKSGLSVDMFVRVLASLQEQVTNANANQESLKAQLKTATDYYTTLKRQMYLTASGYLDMAIAAVGKDSVKAKIYRRLRSRIRVRDSGREESPAIDSSQEEVAQ